MLGTGSIVQSVFRHAVLAQVSRTQVDVFNSLYWAFLVLGTIVGVIVIAYTVYNALKYRVDGSAPGGGYDVEETYDDEAEKGIARPRLGEIPSEADNGSGKKLFVSFALSAIIVLGLIIYAYSLLLYVEGTPMEQNEDALHVEVTGMQFSWEYEYPNGETTNTLYAPEDRVVVLNVTSDDVFHNWGVPELRTKTDAIPGQYTQTWFQADEPGEYRAICYELCGAAHSDMYGDVIIMEEEEFDDWYDDTEGEN